MRIGIVIPDRGDRPDFTSHCLRQMNRCQKHESMKDIQLDIYLVDYPPVNDKVDITMRYRNGYDHFRNSGVNLIAFIENDDWYAADYFSIMYHEWLKAGQPNLFGTNYTVYYHLKLHKYFVMKHETRASAMNTVIKPDLNFKWGLAHDPYTDVWLWNEIPNYKVIQPAKVISIGMKHAQGKCGGKNHSTELHRYINPDDGMHWLRNIIDSESYAFYESMHQKLNKENADTANLLQA